MNEPAGQPVVGDAASQKATDKPPIDQGKQATVSLVGGAVDLPPTTSLYATQAPSEVGGPAGEHSSLPTPNWKPAARRSPPPTLDGYDNLKELARGGMGVVYRARQTKLNRVVALKMILSGQWAGDEQRDRFITEAQSLATLQHPHIVQIFEVGEADGQLFCALEFVDGGTLADKLRDSPQNRLPPIEAAMLIRTLANAMQVAHDQGIVHRDLKPANVMLTKEGIPKITDFGLAKRLDAAEGHTGTAAILGTPNYMAPEQATGNSKDAGTAVDIYALGGILYALLTSHAPFAGDSVVEIINKVVQEEPIPPRRHESRIPRDLENICLKCLSKSPAQRYATAHDLAQDLDRFLRSEPVQARPVSTLARTYRWCNRNRVLAGLALLVVVVLLGGGAGTWVLRSSLRKSEAAEIRKKITREMQGVDWIPESRQNIDQLLHDLEQLDAEGGEQSRQEVVARLQELVAQRLKVPRLTNEELATIDRMTSDIQHYDPLSASTAQEKVTEQLVQRIERLLQEPRMDSKVRSQAEELLVFLNTRSAEKTTLLRGLLDQRNSEFALILNVEAPFQKMDRGFAAEEVSIQESSLIRSAKSLSRNQNLLPTQVQPGNDVEITAEYDGAWRRNHRIGVVLFADEKTNYSFVVSSGSFPAEGPRADAPALEQIIKGGGNVVLEIFKNEQRLCQRELAASQCDQPVLSLTARREGNLFSARVGHSLTLEIEDVFPLMPAGAGTVGLYWPAHAGLKRLAISGRVSPLRPSPLEKADSLYARREFGPARDLFRQQTVSLAGVQALKNPLYREARYKQAICELQLKQQQLAISLLEEIKHPEDDLDGGLWSLRALGQIWLFAIRMQNGELAKKTLDEIERHPYIQSREPHAGEAEHSLVSILLPADRAEIQGFYRLAQNSGFLYLSSDPQRIAKLVELERVNGLLANPLTYRGWDQQSLVRAYRMNNENEAARLIMKKWLATQDYQGTAWRSLHTKEYAWITREAGIPKDGLRAIDELLEPTNKSNLDKGELASLHLDRARQVLSVAQLSEFANDQEQQLKFRSTAKQEVEYVLAQSPGQQVEYRKHSDACLLLGLLLADEGNEAEARRIWQQGKLTLSFRDGEAHETLGGAIGTLNHIMCGSLADNLTLTEIKDILNSIATKELSANKAAAFAFVPKPFDIEALRTMWQTPRGREVARHIAYQDRGFRETMQLPVVLFAYEVMRTEAFGGKPTVAQDQFLWDTAVECYAEFMDQRDQWKVTFDVMAALGLAGIWTGESSAAVFEKDFGFVSPKLSAKLAFVLSHRYRQKSNQNEAELFRQLAEKNAQPGSVLQDLLKAEQGSSP